MDVAEEGIGQEASDLLKTLIKVRMRVEAVAEDTETRVAPIKKRSLPKKKIQRRRNDRRERLLKH